MPQRRPLAATVVAGLALPLVLAAAGHAAPVPTGERLQTDVQRQTADDLPVDSVIADDQIDVLARHGDTIYAAGGFRAVGRYSGPGAILDANTGTTTPTSPTIGDGQVSVVISDGDGGWYLGGDFTRIGGHPAGGLAHVLADGDIDLDFQPVVDGLVSAVALVGDTLWFGGKFGTVDGTGRQNLAAVSVTDGHLLPFSAAQTSRVTELAYAAADGERTARLFVGTEDHVSAVDPVTGSTIRSGIGGQGGVHALLVSGNTLYVGGQTLDAYDATTGARDSDFHSPLSVVGGEFVHALLDTGSRLYVGTSLAGTDRLAALDPATGVRQAAFTTDPGGAVYDLALDGDHLWVGGAFTGGVAVLDATTGDSGRGGPAELPSYNQSVNAVELSGGQMYVGGSFYMTDWVATREVAALDASTLEPKPAFQASRHVYGDLIASSKVLYVADNHHWGYDPSEVAAETHDFYSSYTSEVTGLDLTTGAYLPGPTVKVKNLSGLTTIGSRLYVAQRIESDVRFPHNRILVFNAHGKRIDTFRVPTTGYITSLSSIGGDLLLAGSFLRRTPSSWPPATPIMRLDGTTGKRKTAFNPMINGPVYDLAVQGHAIYAAGLFDRVYVDAPVFHHATRPGVTRLNGKGWIAPAFTPRAFSANRVLLRLEPLDGMLWLGGASRFVDRKTGERVPDPTGDERAIYAMAPTAQGRAWTSWYGLNLGGRDYFKLGYVAASAG